MALYKLPPDQIQVYL